MKMANRIYIGEIDQWMKERKKERKKHIWNENEINVCCCCCCCLNEFYSVWLLLCLGFVFSKKIIFIFSVLSVWIDSLNMISLFICWIIRICNNNNKNDHEFSAVIDQWNKSRVKFFFPLKIDWPTWEREKQRVNKLYI